MKPVRHPAAIRVQKLLGPQYTVLEFDQPTRSAAEAAGAIGCTLAQIAKSLVFAGPDDEPVLIVASGVNRVDEQKVGALLGGEIRQVDAGHQFFRTTKRGRYRARANANTATGAKIGLDDRFAVKRSAICPGKHRDGPKRAIYETTRTTVAFVQMNDSRFGTLQGRHPRHRSHDDRYSHGQRPQGSGPQIIEDWIEHHIKPVEI